jgi:hypothetical protein
MVVSTPSGIISIAHHVALMRGGVNVKADETLGTTRIQVNLIQLKLK